MTFFNTPLSCFSGKQFLHYTHPHFQKKVPASFHKKEKNFDISNLASNRSNQYNYDTHGARFMPYIKTSQNGLAKYEESKDGKQ